MRKVVMNKHNNLLQLEEHFYQLVDVDEPNTFRNLFPYEEIPKIAFNDRIVPHNMPDDIWKSFLPNARTSLRSQWHWHLNHMPSYMLRDRSHPSHPDLPVWLCCKSVSDNLHPAPYGWQYAPWSLMPLPGTCLLPSLRKA